MGQHNETEKVCYSCCVHPGYESFLVTSEPGAVDLMGTK